MGGDHTLEILLFEKKSISISCILKTVCHLFKRNYRSLTDEKSFNLPKILDILLLFYETRFMGMKTNLTCNRIIKIIRQEQPHLLNYIMIFLTNDVSNEIN